MAKVHAGLATHGMAWFTGNQFAGKGQRGRTWNSEPGKNIALSIVLQAEPAFAHKPFLLSAFISTQILAFLTQETGVNATIKWPNDIFINDRKAAGVLIENVFSGGKMRWSIVGIGMNVNQTDFGIDTRATSIKNATSKIFAPEEMARKLHHQLVAHLNEPHLLKSLDLYNQFLYKRNERVKLQQENMSFETTVLSVNEYGQLLTRDAIDRVFDHGSIKWLF